ncbi:MAG TPA: LysR family transcriptional regulator [Gemmataceae bacterium]|jgi:DNA-binding transcriptional LysR family regulator|nr:LysR family transcriptional regulator [Gemmataceae bacterium]
MGRVSDLMIYYLVVMVLLRPNSSIFSWVALSKRLKMEKDQASRAVGRLEQSFGKLVEHRAGRLAITTRGKEVFVPIQHLYRLRESPDDVDKTLVTVELGDGLEDWLLPVILSRLLEDFGPNVVLRFCPLDRANVRANIAEGRTALGCAIETADDMASELVESGIVWRLIVPAGYRLANLVPGEKPQVGDVDRVFVVYGMPASGVDEFVQHVPKSGVVECSNLNAVKSCVKAGHGVGIVPAFVDPPEGGRSIALTDLPTLRVALYLPRDIESVSDAVNAVLHAIRGMLAETTRVAADADQVEQDHLAVEEDELAVMPEDAK